MIEKLKYISIWYDLLSLPPTVFVSRVKKRISSKKSISYTFKPQEKVSFNSVLGAVKSISLYADDKTAYTTEQYLKGKADFLGTGWVKNTDWQKDYKSGFRWNEKLPSSQQLNLGLNVKNADVKLPWEFARMHQLLRVSLYADENQATKFAAQTINNFQENNPVGFGVNWMNAMEVSIRAINLMVGLDPLKWTDQKQLKFVQEHLIYILNHLEKKDGFGNNHYLANLLGLLFGLVYFPQWEELLEQRQWIVAEFCTEIEKQFYTDGGNFEGSTYYHALSTEIAILGLTCLKKLHESEAIKKVEKKITKAFVALQTMQKPNGELPQYGDNDSGRILPLSLMGNFTSNGEFNENPLDISGVLNFGKALFYGKTASVEGEFIKQFCGTFNLPKTELRTFERLEKTNETLPENKVWELPFEQIDLLKLRSYYLPDFGLAVIKSDEFYLSVSLLKREKAHRYRGHFHNDPLSIDLWVRGKQIVADPGNLTYTGDMEIRNAMRSAQAHNAPFTGKEPNRFMPGIYGLFHQLNESKTQLIALSQKEITASLKFGNTRTIRRIEIEENLVRIDDSANCEFVVNRRNELMSDGYGKTLD